MNVKGSKQAKDIREILRKRYPGKYIVRGSTPYEKKCIILKVVNGKKYYYEEYDSNKEAYKAICNEGWGKEKGIFPSECGGEYPEKHVWHIIHGCFVTILENLRLVAPERLVSKVGAVKELIDKFNPYKSI